MNRVLVDSRVLGGLLLTAGVITVLTSAQSISTPSFWTRIGADIHNSNPGNVGVGTPPSAGARLTVANDMQILGGSALLFQAGNATQTHISAGAKDLKITAAEVGIGMDAAAGAKLTVANDMQILGGSALLFQAGSTTRTQISSGTKPLQITAGGVGIGTDAPATALDVNGAITIRGGGDIVEGFNTCEELEPGTVVAVDPEHPGCLRPSSEPYDHKVAGVVSGAGGISPGLNLGQQGVLDGPTKIAMAGRVYVKASAENGPIRAGDRLTTASLTGYAMRATDPSLCDGAVIGKAMSPLDEGTGLILLLVNLQ